MLVVRIPWNIILVPAITMMNPIHSILFSFAITLIGLSLVLAGELTFELPDNEKMCFHEVIDKNVQCTLEFQVKGICSGDIFQSYLS